MLVVRPPEFRFFPMPLAGLEAMTAQSTRSFPRHTHDQYGVGLVDAGGHRSLSDRRSVEAGPGSIICVNPGEVHDGHAIGGRARQWRMLYLDPSVVRRLIGNDSLEFHRAAFEDPALRRLLDRLFRQSDRMQCETLLLQALMRLSACNGGRIERTEAMPSLRQVRDLIEADPTDASLSLQRLAQVAGISPYQLIRAFARQYHLTPHAFIVQKRLNLARELLRTGQPVADVAYRTGFADQSHLTHGFTRQFGIAPGRYAQFSTREPGPTSSKVCSRF